MDRRGQFSDMMLQGVKLVFAALTIVLIIYLSVKVGSTFMQKDKTPQERDMERVYAEIESMFQNEELNVPLQSYGYSLKLIDKNNVGLPVQCKDRSCLCMYMDGKIDNCLIFKNFESSDSPNDCIEATKCVKESEIEIMDKESIITISSRNNIIIIESG